MKLDAPWVLVLLLVIPVLIYFYLHRYRRPGVRFSSTANVGVVGKSWRQRFAWVPFALRLITITLLIIAIARPQEGKEQIRDVSSGIAIEMVVDRSGSMGAEMEFYGVNINRLEVVKKVFREFVNGKDKTLPGRPNDVIGMIVFARYPNTICPLTLAHGALDEFLKAVHLVRRQEEDGTAIGDAIALAAARLKTAEETILAQSPDRKNYKIKSKVIILLTDGQNNFGKRSPLDSATLAREWGIKIYTIGIGSSEGYTTISTPFGDYKMPVGSDFGMDEATLKRIAEMTGGVYRRAESGEALVSIYKEIDRLEKSEISTLRYLDYRELFVPLALAALICLMLEAAVQATIWRQIP